MPRLPIRYAVLMALALPCVPASAETLDQLDVLADAAADETGGITLAREQAARGAYLEALSTLERVLGNFPTSRAALLDHAALLCVIDDHQGGRVELQLLRERDYDTRQFSDAQAVCAGAGGPPQPPQILGPPTQANRSNATAASDVSKPKVN